MASEEYFNVYTDGACSGNPGKGGWGVYIENHNSSFQLNGGDINTTNNRMELQAVIEALKYFKDKTNLNIYTDSKYVMNGIEEWIKNWKINNWKTANKKAVKNKDLWLLLDELSTKHNIEWNWVKGHSGHRGNEMADHLATKAIKKL